jgi:hypothetical protein
MGRGEADKLDFFDATRTAPADALDDLDSPSIRARQQKKILANLAEVAKTVTYRGYIISAEFVEAINATRDFIVDNPQGEIAHEVARLSILQYLVSGKDKTLAAHISRQHWAYLGEEGFRPWDIDEELVDLFLGDVLVSLEKALIGFEDEEGKITTRDFDHLCTKVIPESGRMYFAERAADAFFLLSEEERVAALTNGLPGFDSHLKRGIRKRIAWPSKEAFVKGLRDAENSLLSEYLTDQKREAIRAYLLATFWPGSVKSYIKSFEKWSNTRRAPEVSLRVANDIWQGFPELVPTNKIAHEQMAKKYNKFVSASLQECSTCKKKMRLDQSAGGHCLDCSASRTP